MYFVVMGSVVMFLILERGDVGGKGASVGCGCGGRD